MYPDPVVDCLLGPESTVDRMDYFLDLYGSLPRAGPGDDDSTRRAFGMMTGVPPEPTILDIGCGPGIQTLELIRLSGGTVVALDLLEPMLRRLGRAAAEVDLTDRLQAVRADMNAMPFAARRFDAVWSEGAIYFMGFRNGLAKVKDLVKPGGYVAVTEAVWLKPDPPREVAEFWQAYPEIDTIGAKLDIVSGLGYEPVGHFVLPPSSWTSGYYDPLAERIPEYETRWKGISEAEAVLQEARAEIAMFERYSDFYGYAFFVMRR